MIIKRKNCNLKKMLDFIKCGDTFELGASVYMKLVDRNPRFGEKVACVNLGNGEVVMFNYDTEVIPFNAQLVEV